MHRGGAWIRYPRLPLLRRFVLELWFAWHAALLTARLGKSVEHVVAIFPPSLFFLCVTILLPRRMKRVGIVHDLQGVYAARSRGLLYVMVASVIHRVEKRVFNSCNKLLFLSHSMANRAIDDYGLDRGSCVVCYPFSTLSANTETTTSLAHLFPSILQHIVYAGAIGEKQNPEELLRFFGALVLRAPDICCHMFSGGTQFEVMRRHQERRFQERILFHELVPEGQLAELYARSDVQVIPQAPGTAEGSLPSKLPNLLAAGVPVFAICDAGSELADIVRASGTGHACHSWDSEQLVKEMLAFAKRAETETHRERAERSLGFVKKNFDVQQVISAIFQEAA